MTGNELPHVFSILETYALESHVFWKETNPY